eukprot:TRINITY_DN1900_c0_g1_i2.p1 TRINITY_DN1900_c0_g1~~TRINITY_DN1900_c0_g1_i2.p1  ORF type:complete len:1019 (-),score=200.05 TRINITY_DN1900_c0_g1_i2:680-3736(-)
MERSSKKKATRSKSKPKASSKSTKESTDSERLAELLDCVLKVFLQNTTTRTALSTLILEKSLSEDGLLKSADRVKQLQLVIENCEKHVSYVTEVERPISRIQSYIRGWNIRKNLKLFYLPRNEKRWKNLIDSEHRYISQVNSVFTCYQNQIVDRMQLDQRFGDIDDPEYETFSFVNLPRLFSVHNLFLKKLEATNQNFPVFFQLPKTFLNWQRGLDLYIEYFKKLPLSLDLWKRMNTDPLISGFLIAAQATSDFPELNLLDVLCLPSARLEIYMDFLLHMINEIVLGDDYKEDGRNITSLQEYSTEDLCTAAYEGNLENVEMLITSMPHSLIISTNTRGQTALYCAAREGHEDVVRRLLEIPGMPVNNQESHGSTALHAASYGGHANVVSLLLSFGCDVNIKNNHRQIDDPSNYGNTPKDEARGDAKIVWKIYSESGVPGLEQSKYLVWKEKVIIDTPRSIYFKKSRSVQAFTGVITTAIRKIQNTLDKTNNDTNTEDVSIVITPAPGNSHLATISSSVSLPTSADVSPENNKIQKRLSSRKKGFVRYNNDVVSDKKSDDELSDKSTSQLAYDKRMWAVAKQFWRAYCFVKEKLEMCCSGFIGSYIINRLRDQLSNHREMPLLPNGCFFIGEEDIVLKGKEKKKKYHCFLFDTFMIFTTPLNTDQNNTYSISNKISMEKFEVQKVYHLRNLQLLPSVPLSKSSGDDIVQLRSLSNLGDSSSRLESTTPRGLLLSTKQVHHHLKTSSSSSSSISSNSLNTPQSNTTSHIELQSTPVFQKMIESTIEYLNTKVFGVNLITLGQRADTKHPYRIPTIVLHTTSWILDNGNVEGIFRKSGGSGQVEAFKNLYDSGNIKYEESIPPETDEHVVSNLLKLFLRDLPIPLIPFQNYAKFVKMSVELSESENFKSLIPDIKSELSSIPSIHYVTLQHICKFIVKISKWESNTKMGLSNLSIVFGTNIIRPAQESLDDTMKVDLINRLFEKIIESYDDIFDESYAEKGFLIFCCHCCCCYSYSYLRW